jgi:hypothetical protein
MGTRKKRLATYTFVANFRGGTYCAQVKASDVNESVLRWIELINANKSQIKYLGDKVIGDLKGEAANEDFRPVALEGLEKIWFVIYGTRKGSFHINIIQTDIP